MATTKKKKSVRKSVPRKCVYDSSKLIFIGTSIFIMLVIGFLIFEYIY